MARRSRSHTKRRKHRGGWEWSDLNPFKGSSAPTVGEGVNSAKPSTVAESVVPVATPVLDAANTAAAPVADAMTPTGVAPEAPGVNSVGGRRRRASRKTRRRRGRKY